MPRKPPDPEIVKLALEAVRSGQAQAEVARLAEVSEGTIARWIKVYGASAPAVVPSPAAPPRMQEEQRAMPLAEVNTLVQPIEEDQGVSEIDKLRQTRRSLEAMAGEAREVGSYSTAAKLMRDAAGLAPVISRLLKAEAEADDVLRISRKDIALARISQRDKEAQILSRPLLCAQCSRALSVAFVQGSEPDPSTATKGVG